MVIALRVGCPEFFDDFLYEVNCSMEELVAAHEKGMGELGLIGIGEFGGDFTWMVPGAQASVLGAHGLNVAWDHYEEEVDEYYLSDPDEFANLYMQIAGLGSTTLLYHPFALGSVINIGGEGFYSE